MDLPASRWLPARLREASYLRYLAWRGSGFPAAYRRVVREDADGIAAERVDRSLQSLLDHCRVAVPYYAALMQDLGNGYHDDPRGYLAKLPVLTKHDLRSHFAALKSSDLPRRAWSVASSGGSTGQPVQAIYDQDYEAISTAVAHLFSKWAGAEIGDSQISLWGSDREVFRGTLGWKAKVFNAWLNTSFLNAFRMTPEDMRGFLAVINAKRPALIIAYAQAAYELAVFAEQHDIRVTPQRSILSSAGTLHPFMRQVMERVFGCPVFNRYGTREVGAIASECAEHRGLHVSPWTQYIEVVDNQGQPVPDGEEGRILVTTLANFAMPLVRYEIGDVGALAPERCPCGRGGQILQKVSGRVSDNFRTADGKVVPGEYFIHLIGVVLNTGSISRFQVIQHAFDQITVKMVCVPGAQPVDLAELEDKIRLVMGPACVIAIDVVDDILPSPSGKYLYTVSEVSS